MQKSILIVGGGTAGWLSAAIIASHHKNRPKDQFTIHLVEAADVPTVGVGEGTWPTLRNTIRSIGIDEKTLFKRCFAGFKQGAKFVNWASDNHQYYHPFTVPLGYGNIDLAPYLEDVQSFADDANYQAAICDAGLAPRAPTEAEFQGVCNYAYHLDAGALGDLLKEHCRDVLGVQHHTGTVKEVVLDDQGHIANLNLEREGEAFSLSADMYVDCTGFRSLLLGQALKVPFKSIDDVLFNDTALALRVPYKDEHAPIACHTIATGQNAGWIWDIGLTHRRGIGHVFSSAFLSEDEAFDNLANYVGAPIDDLQINRIKFQAGYRQKAWKHNCVGIGLSGGFVEPLEATAIMLVEVAARYVAENIYADEKLLPIVEKRFNQQMDYRWQRITDFLKLHYSLTKRDEPYWRAHTDEATIPISLQEDLCVWKNRGPQKSDFDGVAELFPAASYQYVLYGMGFKPDFDTQAYLYDQQQTAKRIIEKNQTLTRQLLQDLPPHRNYINHWLSTG
ncbi:tryptophan halogenase family protein [Hirschia litorea]|uniref:Tryptophan halogenase family protein n=1 Tax=Hirschia litorea TaxID=1199156 RepID=A0ABW2IQ60_9PROT